MKKLICSIFALAAIAACSKVEETPVAEQAQENGGRVVKIVASADEATKTTYQNEKTFSWSAGDNISVQVHYTGSDTSKSEWDKVTFTTEKGGAVAEFTGTVPADYEIVTGGLAFYPASYGGNNQFVYNNDNPASVSTSNWVRPTVENPLAVVPLVGQLKAEDSGDEAYAYHFSTATGIVKVTLENLPDKAYALIFLSSDPTFGAFSLDENNVVKMENYVGSATSSQLNMLIESPKDGVTRSFYFPIPVGQLSAGTGLYLVDPDWNVLFEKEVKTDIPVERNRITELAPLTVPDLWTSLGTGIYFDAFIDSDSSVKTEVYQSKIDTNKYRIASPYGAIYDSWGGYTPASEVQGPDDYLYFTVDDTGYGLSFDDYYTGYYHDTYSDEIVLNSRSNSRNRVISFQNSERVPNNIQLAPFYNMYNYGAGWNYTTYDYTVQFAFPGFSLLDVSTSFSVTGIDESSTGAQAYVKGTVSIGAGLGGVSIATGASETEVLNAITGGTAQLATIDTEGNFLVPLPANAPTGKYAVVAYITTGEGLEWRTFSQLIDYDNPDTDYGYTVDDIIGTYTVNTTSNWDGDITGKMVIAASDDTAKGDIMITTFMDIECALSPIYGTLDTKSGKVELTTVGSSNVFSTFSSTVNLYLTYVNNYRIASGNIVLFLTEPGKLYTALDENWICIIRTDNYFYDAYINSFTATREAASAVLPTPVKKSAGHALKAPRAEKVMPEL